MTDKVKSYKDLKVWQKAHKVAMKVLRLFKKAKKTSATYEIWKQALDAVFSVPGNIVEGYYSHKGANYAAKLSVARGEAGEADYWLFVLSEIGDISETEYEQLSQDLTEVIRMLSGLRNKLLK